MSLKSILGSELASVVKVGKINTLVGLQTAGNVFSGGRAEIFLECGGDSEECHDTIAITPNNVLGKSWMTGNEIVDSITNDQAGKIFEEAGWMVKGYNHPDHTRCPKCKLKLSKPEEELGVHDQEITDLSKHDFGVGVVKYGKYGKDKIKFIDNGEGEQIPISDIRSQGGLKKDIVNLVNKMPSPDRSCELTDFLGALQHVLDKHGVKV